jgi:hypothetical protein
MGSRRPRQDQERKGRRAMSEMPRPEALVGRVPAAAEAIGGLDGKPEWAMSRRDIERVLRARAGLPPIRRNWLAIGAVVALAMTGAEAFLFLQRSEAALPAHYCGDQRSGAVAAGAPRVHVSRAGAARADDQGHRHPEAGAPRAAFRRNRRQRSSGSPSSRGRQWPRAIFSSNSMSSR